MLVLTKDKEVWVEYTDEVRIKLRALDKHTFRRLQKQATVKKEIFERGRRTIVEELDEEKLDKLVYDYIIADWEGIVDENGKPLPVTTENKELVTNQFVDLANFLIEKALSLAEELSKRKEEELKNLKNG